MILQLLTTSSENFLNIMNYSGLVGKALSQCENTEKITLSETVTCINFVNSIHGSIFEKERQAEGDRLGYTGCIGFESQRDSTAYLQGKTPEEYCSDPNISLSWYAQFNSTGNIGPGSIQFRPLTEESVKNESIPESIFSFPPQQSINESIPDLSFSFFP